MKFDVKRVDISKAIKKAQGLKDARLRVGWFENSKYNDDTSVAAVAEWQEYGYKEFNVFYPPRSFMRPAENNNSDKWNKVVEKEIKKGKSIKEAFSALGDVVKGDIQEAIIDVMEPPLEKSTIEARKRRGNKSTKPLVDTGVMLASIGKKVEDV